MHRKVDFVFFTSDFFQCLNEVEREFQSTIEHERTINEIHENLISKFNGNQRAVNSDIFNEANDSEPFYNGVFDERPTRDFGLNNNNNNNRNHGFGPTP